ncbi:10 kDa heat shock protein, mitochondrial isoform X2 [Oopsacas minuta]|uniref:10 kDa heat shock protein, mitochondrial n=1 Tax=Oopsacas minuta TaxID=111878 RepID=A0AAV7JLM1_9METZ|nr:10 kDa heat shock protein, mitochondrial isoform X2 [Oopsacas minuta]
MSAFRKFLPLFDRVLVRRAALETQTKGGLFIPEKAQSKTNRATVLAVGPGKRNENGKYIPLSVAMGEDVLIPEYGGTKITLQDEEFTLFRDSDFLGKFSPS